MFEIVFPTTRTSLYQIHQLMADFQEVNQLEAARLQCAKLGGHLYVRSDTPFNNARKRTLKNSGSVDFSFDYSCEKVVTIEGYGRKSLVKSHDQIQQSIQRAMQEGGLADVEFSCGEVNWEPLKKGVNHFVPIVRVTGRANIADSGRFQELMLTGVGKRRSFGLGMVLLSGGAYAD